MTSLTLRFTCTRVVEQFNKDKTFYFEPTISEDEDAPNKALSDSTPIGGFHLFITNEKPAAGLFVVGKDYELAVTQVS